MRALIDVVFPRTCPSCRVPGHPWLCPACEATFPWIAAGCARCASPSARTVASCRDCRWLRPAFTVARAAAVYEGVARDALIAFKLGGERRTAPFLARAMVRAADELRADRVTFVPDTRRARAARGFNPAELLARGVARGTRRPLGALLRKVRETGDQAGLTRAERRRNLDGAFEAASAGGHVLLVDDVLTTGATASACARALLAAGADSVSVLTFARAP